MKTMVMKAAMVAAMLISAGASCWAGGIRIGDTPAAKIAKDTSIPGKGKVGQCLPFAMALQKKFEAAGIASRVIVYGYVAGGVPAVGADTEIYAQPAGVGAGRGAHAVVIYDDGGRTYVMDNQSWMPEWVHNAAPVQMAQQFSGINTSVKMARVVTDGSAPKAPALIASGRRLAAN